MWACREGFYRQGDSCEPCNTQECNTGSPNMIRETCSKGFTRDAKCVCMKDFYMAEDPADEANGVPMCIPCQVSTCEDLELETLVQCPGNTNKDVSRCVPNMYGQAQV